MIERNILKEINRWLHEEKIILLKGARQVGKTTLLKKIKADLEKASQKVIYFSIDKEFGNPILESPKKFISYLQDQHISDKKIFVILDEFQYLKNAGLFLKVLFDELRDKCQFIVSGSSSLEINKNSEFLTGRKIEFFLFNLSFEEFLSSKIKIKKPRDFNDLFDINDLYAEHLKSYFLEYINYGAYPEVATQNDLKKKEEITKDIISTYLHKDITSFLRIENLDKFNNLIRILSLQIGSLLNINEISNTAQINMETCKKYLNILEGTYVFYFCKPFYRNIRKELTKMTKVYVSDSSIWKFAGGKSNFARFADIDGNVVENFLHRKLIETDFKVNYYRTIAKSEIDFVLSGEEKIYLIESKFRNKVSVPVVMKNFEKNYGECVRIIITKDTLKKEDSTYFIPVYLFALLDF